MIENNEVFRVLIPNPLEFIDIVGVRIQKDTGAVKRKRHYLNMNLFYGGIHHRTRMEIVEKCKAFLLPYLNNCPQLNNPPYACVIQYCTPKTNFDLDGKTPFWRKVILDMLGTRTERDNSNAIKLAKIKDDNVKYYDCHGDEYYHTEDTYMIILILKN